MKTKNRENIFQDLLTEIQQFHITSTYEITWHSEFFFLFSVGEAAQTTIEETLSREREEIRRREVHSKDRREEKGEDMKKSNVIEEVQKADAAQNR